jgi:hypothetical protein
VTSRSRRRQPAEPAAAAPAERWSRVVAQAAVTTATTGVVTGTMGFVSLPGGVGGFVRQYALLFLSGGVAAGIAVLAWDARIARRTRRLRARQRPADRPRAAASRLLPWLSALSSISTLTAATLIVLIAVHSPLLPNTYTPTGPHDASLEVRLTAIQASDFLIPADPAAYSLAHLPPTSSQAATAVVAPHTGAAAPAPYRVVLAMRNLRSSGADMFIETVALRVLSAQRIPQPLRVWGRPAPLDYRVNSFVARYAGQAAGESIMASYAGAVPGGHVQLSPQESDELTIDVSSAVDALVRYRIETSYRLGDQPDAQRFVLPLTFSAIFREEVYWVRYTLTDGRLTPG